MSHREASVVSKRLLSRVFAFLVFYRRVCDLYKKEFGIERRSWAAEWVLRVVREAVCDVAESTMVDGRLWMGSGVLFGLHCSNSDTSVEPQTEVTVSQETSSTSEGAGPDETQVEESRRRRLEFRCPAE